MDWHILKTEKALEAFHSSPQGHTAARASQLRETFGPNTLKQKKRRTPLLMIADQFKDILIIILLVAAVIAGVVGDPVEAIAILAIVILNAAIGFVQEFRAEKAVDALRSMAAPDATVLRDGAPQTIPAAELVPGDVVLLEAGRLVPADMRIMEAAQLKAAESALTGESHSVDKNSSTLADASLPLGDRCNMLYNGTSITSGRAKGVVVATGMDTELGKIAHMLEEEQAVQTPLQQRLALFSKKLAAAILVIVAVIFGAGLYQGHPFVLMFLTAVSLAVAAVPEALPAVITISLAFGAKKMVKQSALIRHLPAVETLGSVTYICSDKTGTLTVNQMTIEKLSLDGLVQSNDVPDRAQMSGEHLKTLLQAMALCNDSLCNQAGGAVGDPTETALYLFAREKGFDREELEKTFPRIAEIPFDADRKCMTTFHTMPDGRIVSYTKGAVDALVPRSEAMLAGSGPGPLSSDDMYRHNDAMASEGLRVLAFAMRFWDAVPEALTPDLVEDRMVFLGLAGMIDPPRQEAGEAVELCRTAGIKPVMITGDHPVTAAAIARRLGILDGQDEAVTGRELAALSFEDFEKRVEHISVYARVAPEQKLNIVKALQDKEQFIAMTGDGVNDAPALQRANIGIAMGITGTDVAKEASDMILLDDNFATIVKAVRSGRRIYDNILKFIIYSLTSNAATLWLIFLSPFFGLPLPLLPIQILWMNLLCDSLPGLALTGEPADATVMKRSPRPYGEGVFAGGRGMFILVIGFILGAIMIGFQAAAVQQNLPWQTMLFTSLVLGRMAVALAVRSERLSIFEKGLFSNLFLAGAIVITAALQLAVVYIPALNTVFKTQPLTLPQLGITVAFAAAALVVIEVEKLIKRMIGQQ